MPIELNVRLESIDVAQLGRLDRGEIDSYVPDREIIVEDTSVGYLQNLNATQITRDEGSRGGLNSHHFKLHLDDGAVIPLSLYNHQVIQVKVTFGRSPF